MNSQFLPDRKFHASGRGRASYTFFVACVHGLASDGEAVFWWHVVDEFHDGYTGLDAAECVRIVFLKWLTEHYGVHPVVVSAMEKISEGAE